MDNAQLCSIPMPTRAIGPISTFYNADTPPVPAPTPKPVPLGKNGKPLAIRGADVSILDKSEAMGGIYRYPNGNPGDALEILSSHGMNYIRLRVWVDPADGYHTKERILPMAKRAKDLGMGVLIDFHYSDIWADPGHQDKPVAWANYDLEQLETAVYQHTADVCSALVAQRTPPDMVQIGNEINGGMLWPEGALATYNWQSFTELAGLLKQFLACSRKNQRKFIGIECLTWFQFGLKAGEGWRNLTGTNRVYGVVAKPARGKTAPPMSSRSI